ncbi:MAG: hypothetical protein E7633_08365 [Ruminococcaceae bacterium]|nr:hypothetical protein [Oscillospiraceae bacterium]
MDSIKRVLANWHKMIVVQPDADISDPIVKKNIANIERAAEKSLSSFNKDASDSLFLGKAPEKSNDMTKEYNHIQNIAVAWGSYGTKFYQNKDVLAIILFSIEWMNRNRYGQKEIDGVGWRNIYQYNWHDWDLGSPERLINTLVILGDHVSLEDRKRYLKLFDKKVPLPRDYASNKIHYEKLVIGSALLQNNEEKIYAAVKECEDTNIYVDGWKNDGQGFYSDGSYIFHMRHPMNGTYGIIHIDCVVAICKIFKGTKFADEVLEKRICEWAENTFAPVISKTLATRRVLCRHPDATRGQGLRILAMLCEVAAFTDDENVRVRLLNTIKNNITANPEMMGDYSVLENFYARLSYEASLVVKKAVEEKDFASEAYNINKMFYNEDMMVHHNSGVAYALGMSSSRIFNYECINNQNPDGWYAGDGMLTVLADDFYAYYADGADDNPYRRPGTTVDNRERQLISIAQGNEYLSSQDFVGGLSDSASGIGAMRLESYHGNGELVYTKYYKPDGSYGGAPEKRDCTLLARKAYFFNGINAVCLGCDINAQDDADVLTVIDNRRTDKAVKTLDGKIINVIEDDRRITDGTRGLYLEGFGGYYFPADMEVTLSKGGLKKDFVEIVVQHGKNPENGEYAYAILPKISENDFVKFAADPDFEILANNKEVQALSYREGKKMYVFWNAAAFDGIDVSAPALVMLAHGKIYVSDPTQKLEELTVRINAKEYKFDISEKRGATYSREL